MASIQETMRIEDLKKLCESKIVEDTDAVFSSSSFLDCDLYMLGSILKYDDLYCSQVSMFHGCMNWVKAKANQVEVTREMIDTHLGDLFYEIPFGSMTLEEFADLTPTYGDLFSFDEYQEIVQMIKFKDFQPKWFKRDHRLVYVPQWNADAVIACNRYAECNGVRSCFNTVEKITFTVNKPILLGRLSCFRVLCDYLPVKMTIHETSTWHHRARALYTDKNIIFSNLPMKIPLTKPILIKPRFQYEIQFQHSSAQQVIYKSYRLMEEVQLPETDVIIEFIGDNKTGGIICSLSFNLTSIA